MATAIGMNNPTLADWTKQLEPNGGITTDIGELLNQNNEMLNEMTWMEANGPTYHRSTIRTGLPAPTWRQFYQGVQPTKSNYAQVDDAMGMMEARSVVDAKLASLESDQAQFRLNEAAGFIEGMNQDMQGVLMYGNQATTPQKFNGFMPRLNDHTTALSKENIVDAGGTGTDNTSILLVGWSPRTAFGIFPKGSAAGLQRKDNGEQEVLDASSNRYTAREEKFTWDAGLVVKDWRYVVRIANIDVSNLTGETSATDILKAMTIAVHKPPTLNGARWAMYMNNTVLTMLDIQAQNKTNVYLTVGNEEGNYKTSFRGIPLRRVDQMLNTEARVV
jgi:major capsid protein gp7